MWENVTVVYLTQTPPFFTFVMMINAIKERRYLDMDRWCLVYNICRSRQALNIFMRLSCDQKSCCGDKLYLSVLL